MGKRLTSLLYVRAEDEVANGPEVEAEVLLLLCHKNIVPPSSSTNGWYDVC